MYFFVSILCFQRRLGIKSSDIDDFLNRATAVEEAIKGMRDGTVDPANVKIDGIDTEEELQEKAVSFINNTHKCISNNKLLTISD